jgi:hypothetical protein
MANFVQVGDEIINLDNVIRVERGKTEGSRPTVIVYYLGENSPQATFTDAQAEAVWGRFVQMADDWIGPGPVHSAPGGAGRVSRTP